MKKAFTLIEVVIAVVVLALVGTALLKNAGFGIDFMEKVAKKEKSIYNLSIVIAKRNPEYNHLKKSLYDFVEPYFAIDDLELLKILKAKKFLYQEKEVKIPLKPLEGFSQGLGEEEEQNVEENSINVTMRKISIRGDGGDYIFIMEAE